jgi:hypothetical protein
MSEVEAVIDRIEGEYAVLILSESTEILNVLRSKLPRRTREGYYLKIMLDDGEVMNATIDKEATKRAKKRIHEKLERPRRGEHHEVIATAT